MPNPDGRPLKFKPKELEEKIEEYFKYIDSQAYTNKHGEVIREPYTISGLCRYIGTSRDLLLRYNKKDEYCDSINKARMRVHEYAESQLFKSQARGAMFSLTNNFGWRDSRDVNLGGQNGENPVSTVINVQYVTADSVTRNDG